MERLQAVFAHCGLFNLGEKLSYILWLKGLGEEDEELLEDFLLAFGFNDEDDYLSDELLYQYQIFKTVIKNNEMIGLLTSKGL